jgi:hypothetical protein
LEAQILSLFEEYCLPLKTELNYSLDGFIVTILPGLEEQTSELYPRVKIIEFSF